jgi:hypothetical protein
MLEWETIAPTAQSAVTRLLIDRAALDCHLARIESTKPNAHVLDSRPSPRFSEKLRLYANDISAPLDIETLNEQALRQGIRRIEEADSEMEAIAETLMLANDEITALGPYGPLCSTGVPLLLLLRDGAALTAERVVLLLHRTKFWQQAFSSKRDPFVPGDREDTAAEALLDIANSLPRFD